MKVLCFLFLLIFPITAIAQNFEDDFSDGDFSNDPTWAGADTNFVIFDLDGNNVLRLNDDEAATSYLSTPSSNVVGNWEFYVRIDGNDPSDSNFPIIYLMSDTADLSGAVNGYGVRVGESGDDTFKLMRFDSGTATTILEDTTIFQAGGDYRVNVTRDASGDWGIEVGEGYNGELLNSGNTVNDNTYSTAAFFGVLVEYTVSRSDDFYFDFKIDEPEVVIEPLLISSFSVESETELGLRFSRDIDGASVSTSDFTLNGAVNPQSFSNIEGDSVLVSFTDAFLAGENELMVTGIESFDNDTALADTSLIFFLFDEFEIGDVLINEFLKDPPSGSGVPEYVELINTTTKLLNLKDWQIGDNNSIAMIAEDDLVLHPDTFLVLSNSPEDLTTVFGERNYVDVSLPSLNNSGDQIRVFDGSGNLVDSLEYTSDWGGVDIALERRSIEAASTLQANWGDAPEGIGSPGQPNNIEPDTTPPELESWEFLNDSTILLVFNEEILEAPAEDLESYTLFIQLDNDMMAPEITSADYYSPDSVLVNFEFAFIGDENGENYSLDIRNQQDVFGNIAAVNSLLFEIRDFETAQTGEVAINEFMFDPADDYTEFVELHNTSFNTFNLKDWTFNDNSGNRRTITASDFYLLSGQYVVLAADSTIAENFPGTPLISVSSFPALNNSEDDLVLRNEEGTLIDSLTYFSSWGGDEVSLERRTTEVSGIFQENWGDSPSPNFGTPGSQNLIEPDEQAPQIISTRATSNREIRLIFDERPVEPFVSDTSNYKVSAPIGFDELEVVGDTVNLHFLTEIEDGQVVSITVLNQQDVFGNVNASQSVEVTFIEIESAIQNQVVINEILYRRLDELSPEFVELYNLSDSNFDLSGWELIDAGNNDATIPDGTILSSGEYLVLADRENFAAEVPNSIYLPDFPSLNDSGDEVILKDSDGITIDSLFYQDTWGGDAPGVSLERIDPGNASNDASNWATSTANGGYSAGVQSSVFVEDVSPPEIIFAVEQEQGIRVVFSEFIRAFTTGNMDPGGPIYVQGAPVEILSFDEDNANQVFVSIPDSEDPFFDPESEYSVSIVNLTDIKGNVVGEAESPIAVPIEKNTLVINEILFDPLADSDDNLPDQTEYIELYNPTSSAISLEGITIHDAPDEEDEIRLLEPVTSQYKWIPSGSYFLIYSEDEAESFSGSQTARYFELEEEPDQYTMRIDRTSLSLASSDDAIYLADSAGVTIDSVFFSENWQNPNLLDTDGIAIERIDPSGASNDANNWSSSTHVSGGTPLMQNSIFQEAGVLPENEGISFSPNPFSPDDDGFEDNLFINYTLDAADYLLRVRIFDRYGREVRKLADGFQAGFEGSLIWDGLTDDGSRNRVGIYVVLFEAYNSANGSDRTFKETVVLARMF